MQDDFNGKIPFTSHIFTNKKVLHFVSAFLAEKEAGTDFGRELVFSTDLCYNGMGDENGRTEKSQDHSVERCEL